MARSCKNCFACIISEIYSCPKVNHIYGPDFYCKEIFPAYFNGGERFKSVYVT